MADFFSATSGGYRWPTAVLALLPLVSLAQVPTVVRSGLAPAANARAAARNTPVAVPFSQTIDPATVGTIRVHSAQYRGQRTVAAAVSGSTVTLTPTAPAGAGAAFRPGETVRVTVPTTVQGTGGAAAVPYVYQFMTAVSGGTGDFAGGSTSVVGNSPASVAVGDVDGDGDLDLLTANNNSNNVSVRLNDGQGNFTAPAANPDPAVDLFPAGVVLGDVDGDGDLDFVTVNIDSANLSVRLNDGTGNFTVPAVNPNPAVGNSPRHLALGDVDGDGDLDVVVANHFGDDVSIRLNNGTGSFTASASSPNPTVGLFPAGLALGDVDGDGDLDLVVANNGSSTVSVRLNDSRGSFAALAASPNVAVGANPEKLALGDVDGDGDGDLDFVTANNRGDNVSVRLNNGLGSFTAPPTNADPAVGVRPDDIVLGDVDGDGDLDLLTANFDFSSSTVSVRLNNGLGDFTAALTNPDPVSVAGSANASLALGDMDGDGDLDFVTASFYSPSTACIRLNNGTTLSAASTTLAARAAVYPNPAHDSFTLRLPAVANAAPATATLLNALGQVVSTRVLPLTAGGATATYATDGLAAGLYVLRLQVGKETATLRVVVE